MRISYDGEVKLLDFGIAQALMKFTSEIGVLKGKFSYMSPEQIRGMPLDARTDVFSTGIVLHEMLTTEKLFRGDTEFALMEKVRKAEVPPPSNFNRLVTPELDRVVFKALARDVRPISETWNWRRAGRGSRLPLRPQGAPVHAQMFRKEYAKEPRRPAGAGSHPPSEVASATACRRSDDLADPTVRMARQRPAHGSITPVVVVAARARRWRRRAARPCPSLPRAGV